MYIINILIARESPCIFYFLGEEAKKRWKNLRDCYAKHLRSEKTQTGQHAKNINRYKAWPWAIHMSAFKPFFKFAPTTSNIEFIETGMAFPNTQEENNFINAENNDEPSDTSVTETLNNTEAYSSNCAKYNEKSNTPQLSKKCASKRKFTGETNNQSSVSQVLSYLKNKPENTSERTTYDDMELLFLGHAKTVKKFGARRQIITKFRIAQIIMEEELNNLEDAEVASLLPEESSIEQSSTSLNERNVVQDSSSDAPCSPPFLNSPPPDSNSSRSEATTWYEGFSRTVL